MENSNTIYAPIEELTLAEFLAIRHTFKATKLTRIIDSTENPMAIGQYLLTAGDPSGLGGSFLTATDETGTYPTSVDIGALGANGTKNMLNYTVAAGEATFSNISVPASTNGMLVNTSGTPAFGTSLVLSDPQEFSVVVDDFRIRSNVFGIQLENTATPTIFLLMDTTKTTINGGTDVRTEVSSTGILNNVAPFVYQLLNSTEMVNVYSASVYTKITPTGIDFRVESGRLQITDLQFSCNSGDDSYTVLTPTAYTVRVKSNTSVAGLTITENSALLRAETNKYIDMNTTDGTKISLDSEDFEWTGLNSGTGTALVIDGGGIVTSQTSSLRFKKDVTDLEVDSSKIYDLETKSFSYKDGGGRTFGLIAEETNEILPEVVVLDPEGLPHGINYTTLPLLMLEEIKKLKARIEVLENGI